MKPVTLPTEPQLIASDTWLIPTIAADPSGAFVSAHTLVIRGREPVIVDTGVSLVRDTWLRETFSVVEPQDVRWIFVSHDDHDHIGNLDVVLDLCPNATLIGNFSMTSRLAGDVELPLERMRWVDPGGSLEIGDRVLTAVRPPLFDSPSTRGLHDSRTGVLWAVDSFASLVPGAVYEAGDVPADLYDQSFAVLNSWNTPWLEWVDRERFASHVRAAASLPVEVVASAHGPVHRGEQIEDAFRRTLDLAAQPAVPQPGQELLDALVSAALPPAA
jgi:flavorubredoxin